MNSKVFRYPVVIKEFHLDTFGHINNATYLQLFEEARWELITANDYDLKKIHSIGLGPIILEVHLKFLKEITLREKVFVESEMLSYEKKIGTLRQDVINEAGDLCCHGLITFGLFDTRARKLVLPTDDWKKAIGLV